MKQQYPNIKKAVRIMRDGAAKITVEQMLQWASRLEDIDHVLGRMSKSDFETFVLDGEPHEIRMLINMLPQEWSKSISAERQYRADLRAANKFLDLVYGG